MVAALTGGASGASLRAARMQGPVDPPCSEGARRPFADAIVA